MYYYFLTECRRWANNDMAGFSGSLGILLDIGLTDWTFVRVIVGMRVSLT